MTPHEDPCRDLASEARDDHAVDETEFETSEESREPASPKDTGGPAFPEHHYFDQGRGQHGMHMTASDVGCGGMTLRDWLAREGARIHAEGLLALGIQPSSKWDEIAAEGQRFADAMLAGRKENQ